MIGRMRYEGYIQECKPQCWGNEKTLWLVSAADLVGQIGFNNRVNNIIITIIIIKGSLILKKS